MATTQTNGSQPGVIRHGGAAQSKTNPDSAPIELYPPPRFYIAGPFFNAQQMAIIQQIELWMYDNGVPFYSPRLTERNKKKELDDEDAREIFRENVTSIHGCGAVLAVLDWTMPLGQSVRPCTISPWPMSSISGPVDRWEANQAVALNLPDNGTVWEMGFAYGRKPIYGFTLRPQGEKVNIMLTQCLDGVLRGWDEFREFLNRGHIRPGVAKKDGWKHR